MQRQFEAVNYREGIQKHKQKGISFKRLTSKTKQKEQIYQKFSRGQKIEKKNLPACVLIDAGSRKLFLWRIRRLRGTWFFPDQRHRMFRRMTISLPESRKGEAQLELRSLHTAAFLDKLKAS